MRLPFIIHYPALVKEGTRSDQWINNTDFAPTLIGPAGGPVPEAIAESWKASGSCILIPNTKTIQAHA